MCLIPKSLGLNDALFKNVQSFNTGIVAFLFLIEKLTKPKGLLFWGGGGQTRQQKGTPSMLLKIQYHTSTARFHWEVPGVP